MTDHFDELLNELAFRRQQQIVEADRAAPKESAAARERRAQQERVDRAARMAKADATTRTLLKAIRDGQASVRVSMHRDRIAQAERRLGELISARQISGIDAARAEAAINCARAAVR